MIPTRPLRRKRVLIVGCGDVGLRTLPLLRDRVRVLVLNRRADARERFRTAGAVPIGGDLDVRLSLRRFGRLAASAAGILHFAPPSTVGDVDRRTQALLAAIAARRSGGAATLRTNRAAIVPEASCRSPRACCCWPTSAAARRFRWRAPPLVYASTTGVYGDCGGAVIDETRAVHPANGRAIRRVSAESQVRAFGRRRRGHALFAPSILRIPGIYAATRLPDVRLRRGTPALRAEDDVYTSHIHADDLAAIAVRTLSRGRTQRVYHASDDSRLKMGEYFVHVAAALGLPMPPRVSRAEAEAQLEPMLMSFMRESRRLDNRRLTQELRYVLRYPTVTAFLAQLPPTPTPTD